MEFMSKDAKKSDETETKIKTHTRVLNGFPRKTN